MASIEQLIRREINPFDREPIKLGNFWIEYQNPELTVESIHQEVINQIESVLAQVSYNHQTRTILLAGDSGSGKSHLLGRLKRTLNPKAFFVYIGPWPDSDFIWRHVLRQTVDSLVQVPEGQKESQLLLWLKSLSAFKDRSLMKKLLGERKLFIHNFNTTYPAGIYNPKQFFGVLYDLTKPELNYLACQWLRGDDLDEEDLKTLGVKNSITTEDAAQKILGNFGRISGATQPIVLCFDNLDNIPRLPGDFLDLQPLFNVNSTIHNECLKNFLIIISIVTNTWRRHEGRIQFADKAAIAEKISLKQINLDQAEALWANILAPLHQQAYPQPDSPIYPLTRKQLEEKLPGGKIRPRNAIILGKYLIQEYKLGRKPDPEDPLVTFKLLWVKEFKKYQQENFLVRQFSSDALIQMLREAMNALQVPKIQTRLLSSKALASYSLSYQLPGQSQRVGVVWTEQPNMNTFFFVMDACQKALKQNICQTLYLIRSEKLGKPNTKGYQLHKQIFTGSSHRHITPHSDSLQYLVTYHNLVNAVCAGELVVGDKTPTLSELEALIRESKILEGCCLLQDLGLFNGSNKNPETDRKEYLFNVVKNQQLMGYQTLIQKAINDLPKVNEAQIELFIQELCQDNKIKIVNPDSSPEDQLVCLVPQP